MRVCATDNGADLTLTAVQRRRPNGRKQNSQKDSAPNEALQTRSEADGVGLLWTGPGRRIDM